MLVAMVTGRPGAASDGSVAGAGTPLAPDTPAAAVVAR